MSIIGTITTAAVFCAGVVTGAFLAESGTLTAADIRRVKKYCMDKPAGDWQASETTEYQTSSEANKNNEKHHEASKAGLKAERYVRPIQPVEILKTFSQGQAPREANG